jgi:hypothetical protein
LKLPFVPLVKSDLALTKDLETQEWSFRALQEVALLPHVGVLCTVEGGQQPSIEVLNAVTVRKQLQTGKSMTQYSSLRPLKTVKTVILSTIIFQYISSFLHSSKRSGFQIARATPGD